MADNKSHLRHGFTLVELLIASLLTVLVVFGAISIFTMGSKEAKRSLASYDDKTDIEAFSKELQKLLKNTDSSIVFSSTAQGETARAAHFPLFLKDTCSEIHTRDIEPNLNCTQKVAAVFAEVEDVSASAVCLAERGSYDFPDIPSEPNSRFLIIDLNNTTYGRGIFTPQRSNPQFVHASIEISNSSLSSSGPSAGSVRGSPLGASSTQHTTTPQFSGRLLLADLLAVQFPPYSYTFSLIADNYGRPIILNPSQIGNRTANNPTAANLPTDCFNNLKTVPNNPDRKDGSKLVAIAVKPFNPGSIVDRSGIATTQDSYSTSIAFSSALRVNRIKMKSLGYLPTQTNFVESLVITDCSFYDYREIQCDQAQITHRIENVSDYKFHLTFDSPIGGQTQTQKYELTAPTGAALLASEDCLTGTCRPMRVPDFGALRIYAQGVESSQSLNPNIYSLIKNRIIEKFEIFISKTPSSNTNTNQKVVVRAFTVK